MDTKKMEMKKKSFFEGIK